MVAQSPQDIRPALRERLSAARERVNALAAEQHEAETEMESLQYLLRLEDQRFSASSQKLPLDAPLPDFLVTQIKRGVSDKEALRFAAERAGYFETGESAGRAVHATLMNMVRGGRLLEAQEGIYQIAPTRKEHINS